MALNFLEMKILHGTWIPERKTEFIQNGAFFI